MRKIFFGTAGRRALALLCLVATSAAFWSGFITLTRWDTLWSGGSYVNSSSVYEPMSDYNTMADQIRDLIQEEVWNESLTYLQKQQLSVLKENLSPEKTNYRVEIHTENGGLLYSNLPGGETMSQVSAVRMSETIASQGEDLAAYDYDVYEEDLAYKMVRLSAKSRDYVKCDPRKAGEYSLYGWISDGTSWHDYNADMDTRVKQAALTTQSGVQWPLQVKDAFSEDYTDYLEVQRYLSWIAALAAVSTALSIWLMAEFCRAAGKRPEEGGVFRSWQDRVPLEVYLAGFSIVLAGLLGAGESVAWGFNQGENQRTALVGLGIFTLLTGSLALTLVHTIAVRIKAGELFRNTLIWRLAARIKRFFKTVAWNWPVTKRPVLLFLLYLAGTALTSMIIILIPFYQGAVLWLLCRWARQWRSVQQGTERIVGGEPGYKIDNANMFRDLREHAGRLNDLGTAIGSAVDEQLKSERFKAELITNVSHDLKTPLTSIINYVDLLKKTQIEDPGALEYIEVLDRKSQRLKKLTEDLVEASKASTGVLSVNLDRLGLTQLLKQALGEYEEKFQSEGLVPLLSAPEHEVWVRADGRHLWRVVDNLLGNCVKYALSGTRIYLDVVQEADVGVVTVKNVSREPLNIPAERLLERFVRGDESRTAEGSGLGLSIARSLTELQGGTFRLDIDGDLFKAILSVPMDTGTDDTPDPAPEKDSKGGLKIK